MVYQFNPHNDIIHITKLLTGETCYSSRWVGIHTHGYTWSMCIECSSRMALKSA